MDRVTGGNMLLPLLTILCRKLLSKKVEVVAILQ